MGLRLDYRVVVLSLPLALPPTAASAHGDFDWINKGKYRSAAGELCCGVEDCYQVAPERVHQNSQGYSLPDYNLTVPARQAIPSEDGKYWICKVGARMRCFFAPLNGF